MKILKCKDTHGDDFSINVGHQWNPVQGNAVILQSLDYIISHILSPSCHFYCFCWVKLSQDRKTVAGIVRRFLSRVTGGKRDLKRRSSINTYALVLTEMLSRCTWSYISNCDSVLPRRAQVQRVLQQVGSDRARRREGGDELESPFGCKLKVHFISDELQCFKMKNHSLTHSFWGCFFFFFFCSIKWLSINLLGCLYLFPCCLLLHLQNRGTSYFADHDFRWAY